MPITSVNGHCISIQSTLLITILKMFDWFNIFMWAIALGLLGLIAFIFSTIGLMVYLYLKEH
jgi:putative heme degradation protein